MGASFSKTATLIAILATTVKAGLRKRSSTCLPLFDSNRELFKPCLDRACILFKEEPPFVFFGAQPHPPQGQPFRCNSRRYPSLHGVTFDLLDKFPVLHDAYCLTAAGCTYDDLTLVLDDMVTEGRYIGIVGDFMFLVPYRQTETTQASVTYFDGEIMVYGLRSNAKVGTVEGISLVPSVFEPSAWGAVAGFIGVLLFTRGIIVWHFQPEKKGWRYPFFRSFFRYFVGAYREVPHHDDEQVKGETFIEPKETNEEAERRFAFEYWNQLWGRITGAAVAIVVLHFELAIAVKIFDPQRPQIEKPLHNLSEERLREYVLVGNAASEHKFRQVADPTERYSKTNPPWTRCTDESDCIAKIRDPNHRAKFGITYDTFHKYYLHSEDACDEFAVFQVRGNRPTYHTVWYFNSNVPEKTRLAINRKLTVLEETFRVKKMIAAEVPTADDPCGEQPDAINAPVLLGSLIFITPFIAMILFAFLRRWCFRRSLDDTSDSEGNDNAAAIGHAMIPQNGEQE